METPELEALRRDAQEVEALKHDVTRLYDSLNQEANARMAAEDALQKILSWCEAYPLDIFPEPDLKRAHEVLTANGMTLDSLSAHSMRHVLRGVKGIIDAALSPK